MLGGNDMNVFGAATQGKSTDKKTVAETFLAQRFSTRNSRCQRRKRGRQGATDGADV